MSNMQDWLIFILESLPAFLLAEPIIYLVGLIFAVWVVKLLQDLFHLV